MDSSDEEMEVAEIDDPPGNAPAENPEQENIPPPENPEQSENQGVEPIANEDDNIVASGTSQESGVRENDVDNHENNTENTNKRKEPDSDKDEDRETGETCPICMDLWNNSGEHRLCSLRCGHLFGYSCIVRWLQSGCNAGARRCPQCNHKATMKHIRVLYAKKLSSVDTTEMDKLKDELTRVSTEKNRLELELARYTMRQKLYDQQLITMKQRIAELESLQSEMNREVHPSVQNANTQAVEKKFYLERTIDICKDGGCRVLAYNSWCHMLIVSQKSTNALFSGYGIKKIDPVEFRQRQFVFLHSQAIRDVAFNPSITELLLSVGFDKCAKLMDIRYNTVVHSYQTDSALWSCCWAGNNHNIFLAGAQNGSVSEYDIRQTSGAVSKMDGPGDRTPVVSLAEVAPTHSTGIPSGGFIAARLNTCHAYESKDSSYVCKRMFLEGPFINVCYDSRTNHALVSSRPSTRHLQARHTVCTIDKGTDDAVLCNVVHTFNGGNSHKLLSRPCQINTQNDLLVAAHQESTNSIPIWSTTTGRLMYNLPVSDPVIDLCCFTTESNDLFLATLSEKKLRAYKYSN